MNPRPRPVIPNTSLLPGFGAFLSRERECIVARWTQEIRGNSKLVAANHLDDGELVRPLPEILDALGDSLEDASKISLGCVRVAAYGKTRCQQGYSATEVGRELGALCRLVFAHGLDAFVRTLPRANQTRLIGTRDHVLHFFEEATAASMEPWVQPPQTIRRADDNQVADKEPDACKQSDDRERMHAAADPSFRQFADAMPQIVWTSRPDGTVDYYNRHWHDFVGITPGRSEEAIWRDIVHPDDLEAVRARWAEATASTRPYEMEMRFRRAADGVYRWFLVHAFPIRDRDGAVLRWVGTSTDISERKAAEAAASTIAERLALALDAARLGTWDWNVETREVLWSSEHNAMFDLPIGQRVGNLQDGIERIHPEDREHVIGELQAAMLARRDSEVEMRAVHRDGSLRWVLSRGRALYGPAGKPTRMIGIVQDITAHKTAEKALRESEERFRLANFHSPFPVMLHTDDGEVLMVNDAWTHITGYCPEQILSIEDWLNLAYESESERDAIREFLANAWGHIGTDEILGRRIRCAGGEVRRWDVSGTTLGRLPDGRWLRLVTAVDVTERHQQETELRSAKEQAERANAAKSMFLSRMSHELRTPLNAILGFGQLLELGSIGKEDRQCVDHILRGGRYLLALIDEVLDLSRVEAGELSLKPTVIRLEKMVRECLDFVGKMAQAKGVTCSFKIATAASRVAVWADEQRLRQVLLNLLSNAIKYNRAGGQVVLTWKQRAGSTVRLEVRDTGAGLSPEGLERLFVPFERLGQEFGEVEGTGLGLVVSKRLVDAMDGTLGAESQAGRGSTFWVELPGVAAPGRKRESKDHRRPQNTKAPASCTPVTLLYVEDNASNLQVVRMVVERVRPAWRFLAAGNGTTGLQQAKKHLPSLIILDLQLPDLKGDAVLRELRQCPATTHIPVVMLSADATKHSREQLMELGANGYLSKPFDVQELLREIDLMLALDR